MLANRHMIEDLENMMNFTPSSTGRTLLSERCVNIYSDMGDIVREGDIITLTGELVGFGASIFTLQWQYDDGMYWRDVEGANGLTHSFIATGETINYSWRLSVSADD